jgi:hypothetical protein
MQAYRILKLSFIIRSWLTGLFVYLSPIVRGFSGKCLYWLWQLLLWRISKGIGPFLSVIEIWSCQICANSRSWYVSYASHIMWGLQWAQRHVHVGLVEIWLVVLNCQCFVCILTLRRGRCWFLWTFLSSNPSFCLSLSNLQGIQLILLPWSTTLVNRYRRRTRSSSKLRDNILTGCAWNSLQIFLIEIVNTLSVQ